MVAPLGNGRCTLVDGWMDGSSVADTTIAWGGGDAPFTPFCLKLSAPLDGNFILYINHCHRDPVNIFQINRRNSLFRLLILCEVFDESQLID